jgi:hypothetical protein
MSLYGLNYLGQNYMSYVFGEVESSSSRGQCGGAVGTNDPLAKANASLDDALVNLDKKIMEMEEQKHKLIVQGGMDDAVKALQGQIDQMNDQKVKALAARDLSKKTVGNKTTADQALTDLSVTMNKVASAAKGACQADKDCSDPDMVCNQGLCGPAAWYQVKYWGLPLWGWMIAGVLLLIIIGIGLYMAVPYIEVLVNAGNDGGVDTGAGGMDVGGLDAGSMAGATPGYPGSA